MKQQTVYARELEIGDVLERGEIVNLKVQLSGTVVVETAKRSMDSVGLLTYHHPQQPMNIAVRAGRESAVSA